MEILRQNNYNIVHLIDGKLITEAIELINKGQADGINFNFVKNFPSNIDEIKLAPRLKYIQINDYPTSREFDYSAIDFLSNLNNLSVYTNDKKEINFFNYPFLKTAAINWRPKANSLYRCKNLERLFIAKYKDSDLTKFENLTDLEYLRINTGSIKSLDGIEKLEKLQTLLLLQLTKLEDLNGIDRLPNLRQLRIENCRNIKNIDIVSNLKKIETLEIIGTTPRLKINVF